MHIFMLSYFSARTMGHPQIDQQATATRIWELLFTESFVWLEEPEPSKTASVLRIRGMDQLSWEEKGELELFTLAKSLG